MMYLQLPLIQIYAQPYSRFGVQELNTRHIPASPRGTQLVTTPWRFSYGQQSTLFSEGISSFATTSRSAWGPIQSPSQWIPKVLS